MINPENESRIKELIEQGWQFYLGYDDTNLDNIVQWEAAFTRKKKAGGYDNHKSGLHLTNPDIAIEIAYLNVKNGIRL